MLSSRFFGGIRRLRAFDVFYSGAHRQLLADILDRGPAAYGLEAGIGTAGLVHSSDRSNSAAGAKSGWISSARRAAARASLILPSWARMVARA